MPYLILFLVINPELRLCSAFVSLAMHAAHSLKDEVASGYVVTQPDIILCATIRWRLITIANNLEKVAAQFYPGGALDLPPRSPALEETYRLNVELPDNTGLGTVWPFYVVSDFEE